MDIAEAGLVIGAGAGVIDNDLLPLVEKLAALLEGSIGATRPVFDEGKLPQERLIGQTGKMISPDFYLALGISGATHHIGGVQGAKEVVSVNKDPQAPIFQSSDTGVVADLKEVLPDLIEKITKARQDGQIL